MTKFSESIVGKIKGGHITPVPRWHFLLKSYVFWSLLGVSLLLGSLSFSVIMHLVKVGDLDILDHLRGNVITSTVMLLPYFWVLSLVIFALVAFYNWKHTKLGYRFKRRWIFITSIALSMFLGSIFYALGMGNEMDSLMVKTVPFYNQSKNNARSELWMQPEKGLLVGKVVNVDDTDKQIIIRDGQGKDWKIDEKEVDVKTEAIVKKGKTVKIIGKKKGEHEFAASEIRKCGDCQDDEEQDTAEVRDAEKNGRDLDNDGDGEKDGESDED